MDLSTVSNKLNTGAYATPYDFARDMRLIYQNACTFNKMGTSFYLSGVKLAKKFEEEFERKILDQFETNEFTKKIAKSVIQIIKREDAAPFRMPVNVEALQIKDYFDIITRPMDLGTILNRIHLYRDFRKFAEHVYLVWNNCTTYNPKDLDIHQTALRLGEYTTKQLLKYCPTEYETWKHAIDELPFFPPSSLTMNNADDQQSVMSEQPHSHTLLAPGPMGANLQSDSDHNTVHNAMDSQSQSQFGDHMDIDMNDSTQPPISAPSQEAVSQPAISAQPAMPEERGIFQIVDEVALRDEEEANRLMINHLLSLPELNPDSVHSLDFTQKEVLQRGIQCLDSDHFDPLINMLQACIPEGEDEDDEVELDVDQIDNQVQVKMYNYMLRAVRQQETERIQREGGDLTLLQSTNTVNNNQNLMNVHDDNHNESMNAMDIDHASHSQPQTHLTLMDHEPQHQEPEEHVQQQSPAHEGSADIAMSGGEAVDFQSHAEQHVHPEDEHDHQETEMQANQFAFNEQLQQEQSPALAAHDTAADYTFQPPITTEHASSLQEVHEAVDEDQDIQMMNKPPEAHAENAGEDIVADIANVVVNQHDAPTSMTPVDDTQLNDDQHHTENADVLQTNAETQDPENEEPAQHAPLDANRENVQLDENNETPQPDDAETHVIPTMPALQPDDSTSNQLEQESQDGAQHEVEEGNPTTTNTETQQSEHDEKMQHGVEKNHELSLMDEVNEALNDDRNNKHIDDNNDDENDEEEEEEDDEEVDTPLAADIDF